MKELYPAEPNMLCEKVNLQSAVGKIILPGSEDKVSRVRVVLKTSKAAQNRGIEEGDIIVLRSIQGYPQMPVNLTEDDEVPIEGQAVKTVEVIDPAQVIATYKESDEIVAKKADTEIDVSEIEKGSDI